MNKIRDFTNYLDQNPNGGGNGMTPKVNKRVRLSDSPLGMGLFPEFLQ